MITGYIFCSVPLLSRRTCYSRSKSLRFLVSVAFGKEIESKSLAYLTHTFLEIITLVLNANRTF